MRRRSERERERERERKSGQDFGQIRRHDCGAAADAERTTTSFHAQHALPPATLNPRPTQSKHEPTEEAYRTTRSTDCTRDHGVGMFQLLPLPPCCLLLLLYLPPLLPPRLHQLLLAPHAPSVPNLKPIP
eukprot:1810713-Rhodomonas_salina.2